MRPRFTSTVGADQMAPPDGPSDKPPSARLPMTFGSSVTVYARQTSAPVAVSSATIEPRNVQHS
jgi:hypothetical protein